MAKSTEKTDFLATIRERMKQSAAVFGPSRENQLSDLKFSAGSPDNNWQWPDDVVKSRAGMPGQPNRPTLTINKLPQHIKQVTNDQRQNRPAGRVVPVDDEADVEVAEIYNGMIRHIEAVSFADIAYDTACEAQVTHGEGFWRILTVYEDDTSFDQEIRIARIRNPFSVFMDPMAQDPCGMDAEWWFITEDVRHAEYERKWPKADKISSLKEAFVGNPEFGSWVGGETVRIAEYFYTEYEVRTLNLYANGDRAFAGTAQDAHIRQIGGTPTRSRQVEIRKVKWCKTNGYDILEEQEWAGKYIPIIRVVGNEWEIEGEILVSGIVRNAKDAQRMYNYWTSQEAEMLALAPKAPFVGYAGQFKGFERQWKTANTVPWPYLEINPQATDAQGAVLPLPQRQAPPQAQMGLIQAKMGAAEDIKGSTGQYDASLGMHSNERSGKAINARKLESDTGTYHYVDNLAKAVRYSTLQLVDLIPKIYDTKRVARVLGIDNKSDTAQIDPQQPVPVRRVVDEEGNVVKKIYNPGVGKYDVAVTTGPSYLTKRQEAMESMSQILQGAPQLWQVAGDLFVKNMDWPGAEEMAERIRKTIDPKLLEDGDDSPELQAAQQQIQQMGQQMEQMHQMLKNVEVSMEARDLQIKEFEARIKAYDAETKRLSAVAGAQESMTPEQIQDVVLGTIHGMLETGDLPKPAAAPAASQEAPQ